MFLKQTTGKAYARTRNPMLCANLAYARTPNPV